MLLGCISPSNCLCETVHVPGVQRERACAAARTRGGGFLCMLRDDERIAAAVLSLDVYEYKYDRTCGLF